MFARFTVLTFLLLQQKRNHKNKTIVIRFQFGLIWMRDIVLPLTISRFPRCFWMDIL